MTAALTGRDLQVYRQILALLPPGADQLYDLSSSGTFAAFFGALAQAVRTRGHDLVDVLRGEVSPLSASGLLPEWEAALGLGESTAARYGVAADRQAQVCSRLRELGPYSLPEIRAIVGPLLGYLDPTTLQIVECDRSGLRGEHTRQDMTGWSIPGGMPPAVSPAIEIDVRDDGEVSAAGAQLQILVGGGLAVVGLGVDLVGPAGPFGQAHGYATADIDDGSGVLKFSLIDGVAGKSIFGVWTLTLTDPSGTGGTIAQVDLFVEGVKLDATLRDGLGAEVHHWGVYSDPGLEGAVGAIDYAAARRALARIKPGDSVGQLILSTRPIPAEDRTLPGDCIPST